MDQQNSGQGWQQLQSHIEGFLNQMLINDVHQVEYKPLFVALLTMSSEHQPNDFQKTSL